jgi:hypothetical protein
LDFGFEGLMPWAPDPKSAISNPKSENWLAQTLSSDPLLILPLANGKFHRYYLPGFQFLMLSSAR